MTRVVGGLGLVTILGLLLGDHAPLDGYDAFAFWSAGRAVVPLGAATKFASFVAIPHGWFHDRRGLLVGAAVAAGAWGVSIALSPASWAAYVDHLATIPPAAPSQLLLPALPLAVQLAGAGILSLAAIRCVRLLPVATLLAVPVLGATAPAVLAACLSPVRRRALRDAHEPDDATILASH